MSQIENKNCFDFLRFFFAADIMLAHLSELSQNKNLIFLSNYTNSFIGVSGFFVISGFLVSKSFTNTDSLKSYFIKRAKRILPAYFFVLILAVLFLSVFSTYSFIDYFINIDIIKYLIWNALFLNFVHPNLPGLFQDNLTTVVNGSLWTLKVEEGFYIILPIIFYLIKKTKKAFIVLLSIYFLSIVYTFFMNEIILKPVLARQLPGYMAYFATGIFLYLNFKYILEYKTPLLIIAIVSIYLTRMLELQIDFIYPAAFGIFVIIVAYSLPMLNNFGKYGDFTYGIYIFHFPIIQVFRQYDMFEKYNPILMTICIIVITLSFAIFSWFFVEKIFLDRYKKSPNTKNIKIFSSAN